MKTAKTLPCPKIVRGQKKLTPKQEVYARQFVEERIAAMFSTAAIDEAEAERHLRNAYRVGGIKPVPVRWFDSPIPFVIASVEGSVEDSVGNDVWRKLWSRVTVDVWQRVLPHPLWRRSLGQRIRDFLLWCFVLRRIIKDRIRGNVQFKIRLPPIWVSKPDPFYKRCTSDIENSIRERTRNRVWLTALSGVDKSVSACFEEDLWEDGPDPFHEYYGDKHLSRLGENIWNNVMKSTRAYDDESMWSASRFLHEVFEENPLIHLALFNEMVSGFLLGNKEAWLVRKPIHLELDEEGRLHSENGMCMQYRDGCSFYAWHGVCVPSQVILDPEHLTREVWADELNVEVRRAIQERLGSERFIALVGGTCIDQGPRGELIAIDLKDDPERVAHYVHVQDTSTERQYYLRVPPTITSADEAVAWTFGLSEQEYQPEQET
jgi:hypothetical protein